MYFDGVVSISPCDAVSHALCVPSFLLSSPRSSWWSVRHVDHANRPSFPFPLLRTFLPFPRTWSKVEQLPLPESVTCPPSASLTVVPLHVHTHNPAELCMTSQKHSVRFLCLTALGVDNQIGTALEGYLFFVWCGIIGDLTNGQLCVNDRS
jgi:hypothetical protein